LRTIAPAPGRCDAANASERPPPLRKAWRQREVLAGSRDHALDELLEGTCGSQPRTVRAFVGSPTLGVIFLRSNERGSTRM